MVHLPLCLVDKCTYNRVINILISFICFTGKVKEVPCKNSISLDADKVLGMNEEADVPAFKRGSETSKEGIVTSSGR